MITLASIFRDSVGYIDRWFTQVRALREEADIRVVAAEGDSADDTYGILSTWLGDDDTLLKIDHGGRRFGSVDHPDRWSQIAKVVRGVIDAAGNPGDAFIWVEADLIWSPSAMVHLLADHKLGFNAVCPMVITDQNRFYDTWGYRRHGVRFNQYPPYWEDGDDEPRAIKVDSCGSCFVLAPPCYEALHLWDGRWPFTADGHLWLDPDVVVRHP